MLCPRTYRFTIAVKNTGVMLDGFVMGAEPVNRPNGILFHKCPEGERPARKSRNARSGRA